MTQRLILIISAFSAVAGLATAQQPSQRRASFIGGGSPDRGKCTVEVVVDGSAEVEIRGDTATLRNLAGQMPQWRRFECTSAMPPNPAGFHFSGVDGRGRQELVRDPRNGGAAVVRIDDPESGSEGYTFDITWGNPPVRETSPVANSVRGLGGMIHRFTTDEAVRGCQDAVRQQARDRFRTPDVAFRRTMLDDSPGRGDWVIGSFDVRQRDGRDEIFRFSCSVDFDNGRVRSAQIEPIEGDRGGPRPDYRGGEPNRQVVQACRDAVQERMSRDRYDSLNFENVRVDDRPGRNDWVIGRVTANAGSRATFFDFSCSVNLETGAIRSVDVRRP